MKMRPWLLMMAGLVMVSLPADLCAQGKSQEAKERGKSDRKIGRASCRERV